MEEKLGEINPLNSKCQQCRFPRNESLRSVFYATTLERRRRRPDGRLRRVSTRFCQRNHRRTVAIHDNA